MWQLSLVEWESDIDDLVQDCGISSVSAMEIPHFWTDMILLIAIESEHYFALKMSSQFPLMILQYQVFF